MASLAKVSAPLVDEVRAELERELGVTSGGKRKFIRGGKTIEAKATRPRVEKVVDPVQVIVSRVVKAAKDFDTDTRTLLSEKLVNALTGE